MPFTAILSLLGGGLGGVMRLVPELLKGKSDARDQDHEYRMAQLALQQRQDQADQSQAVAQAQALQAAVQGQEALSGVHWADAISKTVRPFITYWWMLLLTVYKIVALIVAWQQSVGLAQFAAQIWTDNDWGILSSIIGFWFVDRAIVKGRP